MAVQLSITQIHRATLERFTDVIGQGYIYGPYSAPTGRHGQYSLKVRGFANVQAVVSLLWTWLTPVKRDQAAEALTAFRAAWRPRRTVSVEERRTYQRDWARAKREKSARP